MGRLQNRLDAMQSAEDEVAKDNEPRETDPQNFYAINTGSNDCVSSGNDLYDEYGQEDDDIEDILKGESLYSADHGRSCNNPPEKHRNTADKIADNKPISRTYSGGEFDSLFSGRDESTKKAEKENVFYKSEKSQNKTSSIDNEDNLLVSSESLEDELAGIQKLHRNEKIKIFMSRFAILLMVTGCIYAVFLVFGVIMTDYGYNSSGEVEAQVLSVKDIRARNEYDVIKVQYEKLRVVYEDILQLDAQLAEAVDGYAVIGGDYAGLMDETEDLGIKTDALTVESKYQPTKELMYSWIRDYAWNYLVAISQALTNNDSTAADSAIVYKNYMYTVFANITDNVITLGSGVKGVDLGDIRSWDPDVYKQDYLNGKTN